MIDIALFMRKSISNNYYNNIKFLKCLNDFNQKIEGEDGRFGRVKREKLQALTAQCN
jgi:hypothetical protein